MHLPRQLFGTAIRVVLGLGILASTAMASEVIEILADLEGSFRGGRSRMIHLQARVDQIELEVSTGRRALVPQALLSELSEIRSQAEKTYESLKAKADKVKDLQEPLLFRFPEEQVSIRQHFLTFQEYVSAAEVLRRAIDDEYSLARRELGLRSETGSHLEGRTDDLLKAVRSQRRRREARLGEVNHQGSCLRAASSGRLDSSALGHPPMRGTGNRSEHVHVTHPEAKPAASTSGTGREHRVRAEKSRAIVLDLEELIREMEN